MENLCPGAKKLQGRGGDEREPALRIPALPDACLLSFSWIPGNPLKTLRKVLLYWSCLCTSREDLERDITTNRASPLLSFYILGVQVKVEFLLGEPPLSSGTECVCFKGTEEIFRPEPILQYSPPPSKLSSKGFRYFCVPRGQVPFPRVTSG